MGSVSTARPCTNFCTETSSSWIANRPLGFVQSCPDAVQKRILLLIQLGHDGVQITAGFLEILLRLDVFEDRSDPQLFAAACKSQRLFRGADIEARVPDLLEKGL